MSDSNNEATPSRDALIKVAEKVAREGAVQGSKKDHENKMNFLDKFADQIPGTPDYNAKKRGNTDNSPNES
jgi:hypothetical protein